MVASGFIDQVRRFRTDPGIAVLEGFHAVKHALRFGARIELALAADLEYVERLAGELAPDLQPSLRALVQQVDVDVLATAAPRSPRIDLLAFARRSSADALSVLDHPSDTPVVLLENPRHLGNVGAVIRVAAAVDAAGVLTTGNQDPWDPSALRGSAGLHFAVPVIHLPRLVTADRPVVAVDPGGERLDPRRLPPRAVFAFGTERHGLSRELLDRASMRVGIPMRSGISSLNLATAVAVVLFASTPASQTG